LNVVENWNSANSFIFFGKGDEVATNQLEDQKLSVLALHLLQACLVYVNTVYLHVTPYGRFDLRLGAANRLGGMGGIDA
jgi:TnpA family transposase